MERSGGARGDGASWVRHRAGTAVTALLMGLLTGLGSPVGASNAGASAADEPLVLVAGEPSVPSAPVTGELSVPVAGEPLVSSAAVAPVAGGVVRAFEQPVHRYAAGHRGVDLAVTAGEPVRAALAGTVRFAGAVAGERWITVDHGQGLETTYGGVLPDVAVGTRVTLGQRLGVMRPGRAVLDWGARVAGEHIDPLGLLAGWRVRLVPVSGEAWPGRPSAPA